MTSHFGHYLGVIIIGGEKFSGDVDGGLFELGNVGCLKHYGGDMEMVGMKKQPKRENVVMRMYISKT